MSLGPWRRDKFTGLTDRQLSHSDLDRPQKELPARYPDCNIFNVTSMAALVGVTVAHFRDRMLPHSLAIFHFYSEKIIDDRRHNTGTIYAANTTSLMCALEHWHGLDWGVRGR
jgi:hypothetical protein